MERRQLLMAGVGTIATTISGCLEGGGSSGDDPGEDSPQDTSGGGSPTGTTEEGPDDDISNYDPEGVAKSYFQGLNKGDTNKLQGLSHPDGVVIHTNPARAEQLGKEYELTIKRSDLVEEDIAYFYQPSAIVEVGFEQTRKENDASYVTRNQVVLVVEDGELLVYDTRGQDNELQDGEVVDSCEIESDSDVLDLFPYTDESFYHVSRDESFGDGDATYRGPDGNWFFLEIAVHDSEDEAAEAEPGVGRTYQKGEGEWTIDAALLARNGTMTCTVRGANADATDQLETLYGKLGCFTDDHVVERSW